MKRWGMSIFCGMMLLGLVSCGDSSNPLLPKDIDPRQMQIAPTRPVDDSLGSAIAVTITTVGDSITYGDRSIVGGYPGMLEQKLRQSRQNVTVKNEGIPGAKAELVDLYFQRLTVGSDIVLLMVGTNDLGTLGTLYDSNPIAYIEKSIDRAQRARQRILVASIPPQFDCRQDYNSQIRSLNARIAAVAARQQVEFVDIHQAILDQGGAALIADCVHPNDAGYQVIADRFLNALLTQPLIRNH